MKFICQYLLPFYKNSLTSVSGLKGRRIYSIAIIQIKKKMMFFLSINVDSPNCDQAEDVVIDILFESHAVSIAIPEISASRLYSLSLLISQNNLNYVLVAIFSSFLQLIFDCICNLFATWVQI